MAWRGLSAALAVLFAWAASVQLNDPDPARWLALYAGAALIAAAAAADKPLARAAGALGVVAMLWALFLAPELWGRWSPRDLGASMTVARPEVEYGREFGGLLIVAGYCFVVARMAARRRQRGSWEGSASLRPPRER